MDNFKESAGKTIDIFHKYFEWHVIKTLGGGSIKVIEGKMDKKSQEMDMKDGIDWIYTDQIGIKNFGSRIQRDIDYRTFTIRTDRESGAKTELEKRMEARDKGELDDHWTFHGYFDISQNKILSYAIAKTNDILEMIDNKYFEKRYTGHKQIGQAGFYAITWNGMRFQNYNIKIVDGCNINLREKRFGMFF